MHGKVMLCQISQTFEQITDECVIGQIFMSSGHLAEFLMAALLYIKLKVKHRHVYCIYVYRLIEPIPYTSTMKGLNIA